MIDTNMHYVLSQVFLVGAVYASGPVTMSMHQHPPRTAQSSACDLAHTFWLGALHCPVIVLCQPRNLITPGLSVGGNSRTRRCCCCCCRCCTLFCRQVGQALSLSSPNPQAWQQATAAGSRGALLGAEFNAGENKVFCVPSLPGKQTSVRGDFEAVVCTVCEALARLSLLVQLGPDVLLPGCVCTLQLFPANPTCFAVHNMQLTFTGYTQLLCFTALPHLFCALQL